MKIKNHKLVFLFSLTITTLLLAYCSKDNVSKILDETTLDAAIANTSVTDVVSSEIANNVYNGATLIDNAASTLRTIDSTDKNNIIITEDDGTKITIQKTNLSYPITITRDFTAVTKTDTEDGLKRAGIIKTVYTGKVKGKNATSGAKATTTFTNFKIDTISVTGTSEITNISTNTDTPAFQIQETDLKVTLPNAEILTRNGTLNTKMTAGAATPSRLDDVFETTGEFTILSSTGVSWTTTIAIDNPLVRLGKCKKGLKFNSGTTTTIISTSGSTGAKVTSGTSATIDNGDKNTPRGACNEGAPKLKCNLNGKSIDKDKPKRNDGFGNF